jgi:hypothetical protein
MAKISTYPIITSPVLSDILIGSDVMNTNKTKNFMLSDILGLFSNYGSFYCSTTQVAALVDTPYAMQFDSVTFNNNVTIDNNLLLDPTRIAIGLGGVYNIQVSPQFSRTDTATTTVDVWLRKNEVDVPNTNRKLVITGTSSTSSNPQVFSFLVNAAGGDYYEIMWATPDVNVEIIALPVQTIPYALPETPSVLLSVNQVG